MTQEVTLEAFAGKGSEQNETLISEESSFAIDDALVSDRNTEKCRDTSFLERWAISADKYLKQPVASGLVRIATSAASRPMLTIIVSLLLSFTLIFLGLATNFRIETQSYRLWEPANSYLAQQKMWLKTESGFVKNNRYHLYLLLHANGHNVLDIDVVTALFDVLDTVQNTEGWSDVCAVSITDGTFGGSCLITSATNVWGGNRTRFEQEVKNNGDVIKALSTLRYSNGDKVTRAEIFGITKSNITRETVQNTNHSSMTIITHASAYKIDLAIPRGPLSEALDENVQNNVLNLNSRWKASGKNCIIEVLSDRAIDREVVRGIKEDIPLMASSFLIMGCFVSLVLSKWDRVKSQSMLGIGAVVTVGLATISGYGLLFCIGVPFSPLTAIFPFVLVGIGLDDTFIIMGSLSRTDHRKNIIDRVGEVFNEVGIGILASTLTTVLAFGLGIRSRISGIRWFALYAAPSVLIDFVFQITFFVALISYDDTRMKNNRHDCPFCCRKRHATELTTNELTDNHDAALKSEEDGVSTRMWLWYSENVLLKPLGKMIVLVAFAVLAGLGSWGASQQSQQFDTRTLLPPDSFVVSYFHSSHEYTDASSALVSADIFFRNMDVTLPHVQEAMTTYVNDLVLQLSPYITTDPSPRHFWLRDFQSFVQSQAMQSHRNATSFRQQLDVFLNTEPFSSNYSDDIVRDKDGVVTASRTRLHFDAIDEFDSAQQIRLLQEQYDITQSQPLNLGEKPSHWNMFTFGPAFTYWEITRIIPQEIVTNICMGLLATAIMGTILIPHPMGFLLLPLVVGVVYVELLGLLRLANLYVNAVTAIGLTMGIGLVVDYNIHIVMAYFECTPIPSIQPTAAGSDRKIETLNNRKRRNERVQQVVLTMGKSIFLCAMSTLLGILPLCGSSSDIFWSFFVTFVGIVFLGASHGLILMPVLLSLFGPILQKQEEKVEEKDDENTNDNNMIMMDSLSD